MLGKTAAITAASSGCGAAPQLAAKGASTALVTRRRPLLRELAHDGPTAAATTSDVGNAHDIQTLGKTARARASSGARMGERL